MFKATELYGFSDGAADSMKSSKRHEGSLSMPDLYENAAAIRNIKAPTLDVVIEDAPELYNTGSAVTYNEPAPAILAPKPKRFTMEAQSSPLPKKADDDRIIVVEAPELYSTALESTSFATSFSDQPTDHVDAVQLR